MIRSEKYGLEVERLRKNYGEALAGMADDLMLAGLIEAPDYKVPGDLMLRTNDRFHELTGDRGAFLGSVNEALAEHAKNACAMAEEM